MTINEISLKRGIFIRNNVNKDS